MQGSVREQLQDLSRCVEILKGVVKQEYSLEDGLSELLAVICQRIGAGAITGTFVLTRSIKTRIMLSWSADGGIQQENATEILTRGLIRVVQQRRQSIIASDFTKFHPPGYSSYSTTLRSELAVPLLLEDHPIGAVDIGSSLPEAFGIEDELWLQQIATLLQFTLVSLEQNQSIPLIVNGLAEGEDIDLILDEILKTALQMTKLPDAYARIIVVDGDRVVPKRAFRIKQGKLIAEKQTGAREWSQLRGITGRAIRDKEVRVVSDVQNDTDYFKHQQLNDTRSEAAIPVLRGSRLEVVGALDLQAPTAHAFTEEAIQALKALAGQINLAIYTAQVSETLKREQNILEKLARVTPSVVKSLDLDYVYDLILEATFSLLPTANSAQILTVEEDLRTKQRFLVMKRALPSPQDAPENRKPRDGEVPLNTPYRRFSVDRGVTGAAVRQQEPVYIQDVETRAAGSYLPFNEETRAEFAIPLSLGNTVLGVLNIESEVLDAFSKRDRNVAELLAAEAGFAISNAQNYTRTIDILNVLVDATRVVVGTMEDVDRLIDSILAGALRVTKAEDGYCGLVLVDKTRRVLAIKCERGDYLLEGRLREWPWDQGLSGRAIQTKEPINIPDIRETPEYIPATSKTRSNLIVPLLDRERNAVGALDLESPVEGFFNEDAVEALQQFGPIVVDALEKSQLVRSLQQQQQETVDLLKQVAHLLRTPLFTLREGFKDLRPDLALPASLSEAGAATDFLDLMLGWLDAQAEVLGQVNGQYSYQKFEVREFVTRVVSAYRYYAERKPISLIDEVQGDPLIAEVSREEVLGALVETLENATKYSPPHSRVWVRVDRILNDVHISVEDEGKGVLPAEREQIYSRGARGSNTVGIQGNGLGLYFVRRALYRQGGDAFVESGSRYDRSHNHPGSRFILKVPVLPGKRHTQPRKQRHTNPSS